MCAWATQVAYIWTGSASQPQHVWCALHVLCSCAHTVSQMDPVHAAFTLSSAQSINYRGNQANDTCTQCRISACFWTSCILSFVVEVKRGRAWDNPDTWGMFFLMYDLPKRWFCRSCKKPVVHLWTGTQTVLYELNQCIFHLMKERKCLIHDSWTKLRMKSYQSKNAPFKQCNTAPRCINLWSKIKPHDPHS